MSLPRDEARSKLGHLFRGNPALLALLARLDNDDPGVRIAIAEAIAEILTSPGRAPITSHTSGRKE